MIAAAWWKYVGAIVLGLAFYWPMLSPTAGWSPFGDYFDYSRPNRIFAESQLRAGKLPIWTDALFGGFPYIADPQGAVFHPPHLAQALIGGSHSTQRVRDLTYLAHLVAIPLGIVLLASGFGIGGLGSMIAAAIGGLSGFVVMHLGHSEMIEAFAMGVWAMAAAAHAVRRGSLSWAITSGLFLGIAVYPGQPQPVLYSAYALAVGAIAWAIVAGVRARSLRPVFRTAWIVLIIFLLAVLTSAMQWLPTAELSRHSVRNEYSFAASNVGLVPIKQSPGLLMPGLYSPLPSRLHWRFSYNPLAFGWGADGSHEFINYFGVSAALLGIAAIFLVRRKAVVALLVLGVAGILMCALGKGRVYEFLFYYAPGFGRMRIPPRLLGISNILLGLLAGLTIDSIIHGASRQRLRTAFLVVLSVTVVALAVGLTGMLKMRDEHESWLATLKWAFVIKGNFDMDALRPGPEFTRDIIFQIGIGVVAAAAISVSLLPPLARKWPHFSGGVAALAVLVELFLYGYGRQIVPLQMQDEAIRQKDAIYAAVGNVPGRVVAYGNVSHAAINNALLDPEQRRYAGGYNPMIMNSVQAVLPDTTHTTAPGSQARLDIWNVTHIAVAHSTLGTTITPESDLGTSTGLNALGYRQIPSGHPGFSVYERPAPPGFAWMVPTAEAVSYRKAFARVASRLAEPDMDVWNRVLVSKQELTTESILAANASNPDNLQSTTTVLRESSTRVHYRTEANQRGWLVMSHTWYPGWSATIDGKETPLYRANGAHCTVMVPEGEHTVTLTYANNRIWIGMAMTTLALVISGGYGVWVMLGGNKERRRSAA